MMAKFLKSVIVLAMVLTFFGGTAMADRRGRDYHHPKKGHRHHLKHHHKGRSHYHYHRHIRVAPPRDHHRRHVRVVRQRPTYRQPRYHAADPHPLAPRIVFLGGLPVPVPPPPHEVLDYLTGR